MQQNFIKMNSKIILTFSFDKSWIQEMVPQLYYVLVIVLTNTENIWLDNYQLAEKCQKTSSQSSICQNFRENKQTSYTFWLKINK